jgi:hypothetical protein
MTQDKIKEIIEDSRTLYYGESVYNTEDAAKEIYKLHLESQLELLHKINDDCYNMEVTDAMEVYCMDLETKLKELE